MSVLEDSEKFSQELKEHVDLSNNVNAKYVNTLSYWYPTRGSLKTVLHCRIQNPLYGIPHDKLLQQVETFAQEYEMTDIVGHLRKGALLAQNPAQFETIDELDESDREVIQREKTRKSSLDSPID